jgi:hypothetical protein
MGSFNLTPEAGSRYLALFSGEGASADTHALPEIFDEGLVLNVNQQAEDELVAVIKTNSFMLARFDSLPLYL